VEHVGAREKDRVLEPKPLLADCTAPQRVATGFGGARHEHPFVQRQTRVGCFHEPQTLRKADAGFFFGRWILTRVRVRVRVRVGVRVGARVRVRGTFDGCDGPSGRVVGLKGGGIDCRFGVVCGFGLRMFSSRNHCG
jgi:hypothetical protein